MIIGVLTDEVLAMAERLYLAALMRGEAMLSVYHGGGGSSAGLRQGWSAEEKKKWLT